jgi:hypothetical protein
VREGTGNCDAPVGAAVPNGRANLDWSVIMTKAEIEAEALDRARNGETMTNYPEIFAGFIEKGNAEHDIKPRENVFTFAAWKALGRSVKRGEHGVKVVAFIDCAGRVEIDQATGEEKQTSYRRPHTTTVFHISQTELTAEREARKAQEGPRRLSRSPIPATRDTNRPRRKW